MESVTFRNRTLTLPKSYDSFLEKGSEFILFKSGDELLFKQVRYPDLKRRALKQSRLPIMSLSEINEIVHDVRRKTYRKK